jgi:2-desacetyl-2-hydroxyethyl bacteriochlorophyllide A dehydrogenase
MSKGCRRVYFAQPYTIEVATEPRPEPGPGEVLVRTEASAISAGTELLFYCGQVPPDIPVDTAFAGRQSPVAYPIAYGYAAVGTVVATGDHVAPDWLSRRVFAFQPHASYFTCHPGSLQTVPDELPSEVAALYPNVETAVNLVLDAAPLIGEHTVIMGQGVVGLLILRLLNSFPLASITVVDAYPQRRELALRWGAARALSPDEFATDAGNPDLIVEVSGNPQALNAAVACAGFDARIIIGSWYGQKQAHLDLGGAFHRNRVRLLSSQVSTVAPQRSGRWDRARRTALAWEWLRRIPVQELITHRVPLDDAPTIYRLLDERPEGILQAVFHY